MGARLLQLFKPSSARMELLACEMVAYAERCAALGATAGQYLAAVLGLPFSRESMLVDSATVGGLKSPFHFYLIFNLQIVRVRTVPPRFPENAVTRFRHSGAKLIKKFPNPQILSQFTLFFRSQCRNPANLSLSTLFFPFKKCDSKND